MAFPDLNCYSRAYILCTGTSQRIQGITSTELMCEVCMKPTWFEVKAETPSSPSSEDMAPALFKYISGKAHTFCNYRIYKHLPKLLSMIAKEPSFACEEPMQAWYGDRQVGSHRALGSGSTSAQLRTGLLIAVLAA